MKKEAKKDYIDLTPFEKLDILEKYIWFKIELIASEPGLLQTDHIRERHTIRN